MEMTYLSIMNKIQTVDEQNIYDKLTLFIDIHHHLLEDESPSNYLNEASNKKIFKDAPFSMLNRLKETKQSPIHHPEGNVWNHTMLVVNEAAGRKNKSKDPDVLMWAALLHDIGKPDTTRYRKGRITSYDHDTAGEVLAKEFLEYFSCKDEFIEKVVNLVRFHMHILYVLKDLQFGNIELMKKKVDLHELALLGLCDRLGRLNPNREEEEKNLDIFLTKVNNMERSGKTYAKK
ncbi:HDIG domain-containing metalloprotein [Anaerocolumna sedimenticola]|nr:HDIG domain-containing metalloprotein [Anaerocolumna sedimenticola]